MVSNILWNDPSVPSDSAAERLLRVKEVKKKKTKTKQPPLLRRRFKDSGDAVVSVLFAQ